MDLLCSVLNVLNDSLAMFIGNITLFSYRTNSISLDVGLFD